MVFFPGIISFFNLNNRMSSDSTDPRDIIPPPPKSLCVSEKGKGRNYYVTSRVYKCNWGKNYLKVTHSRKAVMFYI